MPTAAVRMQSVHTGRPHEEHASSVSRSGWRWHRMGSSTAAHGNAPAVWPIVR